MRCTLVPLLALAVSPAFAQLSGDAQIRNAMTALGSSPNIYMSMTGTETLSGNGSKSVTTTYTYATYFSVSTVNDRVLDQLNLTIYDGIGASAKPVAVYVADGVTLWRYEYATNSYMAVNYGTYSGPQPGDYTATLFRYLGSMTQGYMAYPTTMLRQIYGGGLGYQSWLPGVTPTIDASGNVVYSVGVPPRRTITFNLSTGALTSVSYDDTTVMRGLQRNEDWSINVLPYLTTNAALYVFRPPAGSRAVAAPHLAPRSSG